jgi:hypothetical protein
MAPTDYALRATPRISKDGFRSVLAANHSPAATEAGACYEAFVNRGIDPAVGLAIFRKESTYGRFGRANVNRSWGNNRSGPPKDDKGFTQYPTWAAGAAGAAALLVLYARNEIKTGVKTDTVLRLPFVWAPAEDHNSPSSYGPFLAKSIGGWAKKYPQGGEVDVYSFELERWTLDQEGHQVTTIGAPIGPDGAPDWSRRLAIRSDKGGRNLRLELIDRHVLKAVDWSAAPALENALLTFSLPGD